MIVVIVIAGIFVPLAYIAFTGSMKQGAQPEAISTARNLAQQKMEELTSYPYDHAKLNPGTYNESGPGGYGAVPGHGNYQWKWTIGWVYFSGTSPNFTLIDNPSQDKGYKKILVFVQEPGGYEYNVWTLYTKKVIKEVTP
jgi:type II secretory pathway pseudopilin PulG